MGWGDFALPCTQVIPSVWAVLKLGITCVHGMAIAAAVIMRRAATELWG